MKKVAIIHGPNLDRLGTRDPEIYGSTTLKEIEEQIHSIASSSGIETEFFQSNHEGEIVDAVAKFSDSGFLAGIINAGGYTHTSVAVRDAIECAKTDYVEVHLSNIYAREEFRQKSLLAGVCTGSICGLGTESYLAAIRYWVSKLNQLQH